MGFTIIREFSDFGDFWLSDPFSIYVLSIGISMVHWTLAPSPPPSFHRHSLPLIKTPMAAAAAAPRLLLLFQFLAQTFSFDFSGPRVSLCFLWP
jgi:hypothetical protein